MAREKPAYRDNLERLCQAFPNKEILRTFEVATFLGVDRRTASKMFTFRNHYISKATLARELS